MAEQKWSGMAIAGFVLSFFGFLAILGIIFSTIGLSQTKNHKRKGRGLAIAGLIISILVLIITFSVMSDFVKNVDNLLADTEPRSGSLKMVDSSTNKESSSSTASKNWNKVAEITGQSAKVTDTFNIKGSKWRFTWSCVSDAPGYDGMNIFPYSEEGVSLIDSSIMMGKCSEGDTTYIYEGANSYYFDIDSANVKSWKVVVEDYY